MEPAPEGQIVQPPPIRPQCWKCGYELAGIRVDGRCPECGTEIWSGPPGTQVNSLATTAMVLGIVSLALCITCIGPLAIVIAIPGVVMGHMAAKQARMIPGPHNGAGMARAGIILGWVTIGISLAIGVVYAVAIGYGWL